MVTSSFAQGISNLVNSLAEKHGLHFIYISAPEREREAKTFSKCCYVHPVVSPKPVNLTGSLTENNFWQCFRLIPVFIKMFFTLRTVVSKYNIDIVNAEWSIPSGFIACLACRNIPVVTTLRGSDINMFGKRFFFRQLIKYTLNHSTRIIALADDLRGVAIEMGTDSDKIELIPSGIDMRMFRPVEKKIIRASQGIKDCFQAIFVGNLIPLKRVDMIVRVCARLSQRYSHISLVIVGEGPEHAKLVKLARDEHFGNIQFTGRVEYDQMPAYMNAADVLVLPSESEGLPDVVQEAMACGITVIASNVGGLPELITDGVNGFLVNSEAEMEECLRQLISNPELRIKMGANAREFATRYLSNDKVVKQTEELYQSILIKQQ